MINYDYEIQRTDEQFLKTSLYGTKSGVKFRWSCDSCLLLISTSNEAGGKSKKELPGYLKQTRGSMAIHSKKFQSRFSKQTYLYGKSYSQT